VKKTMDEAQVNKIKADNEEIRKVRISLRFLNACYSKEKRLQMISA